LSTARIYKAIGLMSGTSLDGVDVALIETDGQEYVKCLNFLSMPYQDNFREDLRKYLGLHPGNIANALDIEKQLTHYHAQAVEELMSTIGIPKEDIDIIGFHGQTLSHAPEDNWTLQIGDGALLSALTGIDVVNDFRSADVRAGGQGAPLVPVYHQALASSIQTPIAILNIGGVANITWLGQKGEVLAFDTGPGNAFIDDWILSTTGQGYDDEGKIASRGIANKQLVKQFLEDKYFAAPAPKSLDRHSFNIAEGLKGLSVEDGAATLLSCTVLSIKKSLDVLPEKPVKWFITGGGRHNKEMMTQLQKNLGVPIDVVENIGWNGDAVEAEAFAYLAVRSLQGLPLTFPGTTGVKSPLSGGVFYKANEENK